MQQLLRELNLDPAAVTRVEPVPGRHGHRLWRVSTAGTSYFLKEIASPEAAEVAAYRLLEELGVPTVACHASSARALLLEDLASSPAWRLAEAADMDRPETGTAVAGWYLALHAAGERLTEKQRARLVLQHEWDVLTPGDIMETGERLGMETHPVWRVVAAHIDQLKAAARRLDLTLNHNDFHWTNLALSRASHGELLALVFDHHLLGMGMRYSDCRNVMGSLGAPAARAFLERYGACDPRERVLDRPLAILHALHVAARREVFPRWAAPSRTHVMNGGFDVDLHFALALARNMG